MCVSVWHGWSLVLLLFIGPSLGLFPFLNELCRKLVCIVFHVLENVVISVGDDELAAKHTDGPSDGEIPRFVVVRVVY